MPDDISSYFDAKEKGQTTTTTNSVRNPQQVLVDNGIRYIYIGENSDGWVDVRLESDKQRYSVCGYTKLQLLDRKDSRIFFKILDGRSAVVGKLVSMNAKSAPEYLRKLTRKNEEIHFKVTDFNQKPVERYSKPRDETLYQYLGQLDYGSGTCEVTLTSDTKYPKVAPGTYRVGSPDYSHDQGMTEKYRLDGKKHHDAIWFPINYGDQSHYIHVGHLSHGCVTVYKMDDWDKVYPILIQNRTDDKGLYCAKITVVRASAGNSR